MNLSTNINKINDLLFKNGFFIQIHEYKKLFIKYCIGVDENIIMNNIRTYNFVSFKPSLKIYFYQYLKNGKPSEYFIKKEDWIKHQQDFEKYLGEICMEFISDEFTLSFKYPKTIFKVNDLYVSYIDEDNYYSYLIINKSTK